jgi:cobalt-zinc-cadmium efflux system outer membrane protein
MLLLSGLFLLSGCLWPVREKTDQSVAELSAHAFDVAPDLPAQTAPAPPSSDKDTAPKKEAAALPPTDLQTTALMQPAPDQAKPPGGRPPRIDLKIPPALPGSEAPLIKMPEDPAAKAREVRRIYPELPPLPEEPTPLPGPDGRPYTLADLQRIAAENSPTLRQAASDVQAAKGNVIQARAYPNPTVAFEQDPNNASQSPGAFGFYIEQLIKTGGKLKLQAAAAEMDLLNAEVALKRARSDLATQVRNAYFALVVSKETMRVSRALAEFTDQIYRLQAELLAGGFAATYEPATLRAQAYTARLAYKQAITTYVYNWNQLVAVVGLRHLPLSEVAGRVDRLIPFYDYDAALAHVLRRHTDVLTAGNGINKARYNLKLAQVTPIPDITVHVATVKESTLPPFTWYTAVQVGGPIPIWDQNKGNIIAAQAALERALEEPHRVETTLTNNFANAYTNYKNNLDALEYYRRHILPDQVRYYRGVFDRRQIDPAAAFGDLVQAQQTLATNVATYLTVLGQLWTSVVSVADFLQTDDLFQAGTPKGLPELPDLGPLPAWPCPHPVAPHAGPAAHCPPALPVSGPVPLAAPSVAPATPAARPATLPTFPAPAAETPPSTSSPPPAARRPVPAPAPAPASPPDPLLNPPPPVPGAGPARS